MRLLQVPTRSKLAKAGEQNKVQPAAVQQDGVETHSQNKILAGKEAEQHRGKLEHRPSLWADREAEHQMGWSSLAET